MRSQLSGVRFTLFSLLSLLMMCHTFLPKVRCHALGSFLSLIFQFPNDSRPLFAYSLG